MSKISFEEGVRCRRPCLRLRNARFFVIFFSLHLVAVLDALEFNNNVQKTSVDLCWRNDFWITPSFQATAQVFITYCFKLGKIGARCFEKSFADIGGFEEPSVLMESFFAVYEQHSRKSRAVVFRCHSVMETTTKISDIKEL